MSEILVIGAGPAGIAAALAATECGRKVAIVDDNAAPGGQIWRNESNPAIEGLRRSAVTTHSSTTIYDAPAAGVLLADQAGSSVELRYDKLIIATGARELFIPFPGWDSPNVFGAGGLQAFAKGGLPVKGKRVAIAGSGPLLLAVAAYLHTKGARITIIAEQAPKSALAAFAAKLVQHPAKLRQAVALQWQLRGIEYATSCWPVEARSGVLKLSNGRTADYDYLACGFGLVPNTDLCDLLGCNLPVNEWQQTSSSNIYAAGEITGIGGSELAEVEGRIAGYAAAGDTAKARSHFTARTRAQHFADAVERTFRLRDELRSLPTPETTVCRCEDVRWGRLQSPLDWRTAKLHTRCGMGPCQGRVCGPALSFLLGWQRASVRPPLYPVPVRHLTASESAPESHAGAALSKG